MTVEDASDQQNRPQQSRGEDYAFWLEVRRVILDLVEVVERKIEIKPTTSEVRKEYRRLMKAD